jgi:hypothetical protein
MIRERRNNISVNIVYQVLFIKYGNKSLFTVYDMYCISSIVTINL